MLTLPFKKPQKPRNKSKNPPDPDYDREPPKEEDPNSLRSLVASESLEKDRGDVKAATGNKNFDEEGTPEQQQAPAAPAPQQEPGGGGGGHLERSREPAKPGSSHPVMDSSK